MLLQALCIISYPLVISNLSYSPETPNLGQMRRFLKPRDLEIWRMTLKNNRAPLLCYFKLCAAFRTHWWIQTGVTVRKCPIWVKFDGFLEPCDLDIWRMTFKNNRAPLLFYFKLCAAFHSHWWIGETPNLGQIRRFYRHVTLKFDGWPWKTIGHPS